MMRNTNDDRNDNDKPPYSRLFIVCGKHHVKEDLLPLFEKYGLIEDLHMPKDRNTGLSKGIAFVKYNKTSSAAAAIQDLHKTCIQRDSKPIKVMVASNKNEGLYGNEEKFKRLFIKVQRSVTENEIIEHFSRFGVVASVHLLKDKSGTEQCRGFAYVNFNSFLDTANAIEQCDSKYKPIFATPKDELKRPRVSDEFDNGFQHVYHNGMNAWRDDGNEYKSFPKHDFEKRKSLSSLINTKPQNFNTINVLCSPAVSQKCIEPLFNIIPGVVSFRYSTEFNESKAVIKYDTEIAATHAAESLNHYEFPSGQLITITPISSPLSKAASNLSDIVNTFKNAKDSTPDMLQLAEAIAEASSLIKAATSKEKCGSYSDFEYIQGVKIPFAKPLADKNSRLAKRCFLVLKPVPPPHHVLQNLFCRFGDLIDVSIFPNKTFGFAKYASDKAADEAILTLHGTTLYGVKFKVIEADEKPLNEEKIIIDEEGDADHDMETKRAKLGQ